MNLARAARLAANKPAIIPTVIPVWWTGKYSTDKSDPAIIKPFKAVSKALFGLRGGANIASASAKKICLRPDALIRYQDNTATIAILTAFPTITGSFLRFVLPVDC